MERMQEILYPVPVLNKMKELTREKKDWKKKKKRGCSS
jgi:hypothetical protein